MKSWKMVLAALIVVLATSTSALAVNITIFDGQMGPAWSGSWYYTKAEDQEVEFNAMTGQNWDLEAFVLQGSTLSMIGGFDFKNGYRPDLGGVPGDIFFETGGPNASGYDYGLKMNFGTSQYTIYLLDGSATLLPTTYLTPQSDPWAFTGGTAVYSSNLVYAAGLSDADVLNAYGINVTGGSHYAVDLYALPFSVFFAHYTMECGNDVLHGAVPEPGTMMLLGSGLIGLAGWGRKKFRK